MDFWATTEADVVMAEKSGTDDLNSKINGMGIWNTLQDDDIFPKVADKLALYMLLFRYIIKYYNTSDKADIYNNYYKKGRLASCVPANVLAERTGKSERTVYRQIKDLENLGVIKIDRIKSDKSWDKQLHSIYTLGTHDLNGNETYFIKTTKQPALTKTAVFTKQSRGSDKCSG